MPVASALRRVVLLTVVAASASQAQQDERPVYGVSLSTGWHAPVSNHSAIIDDRNLLVLGLERRFTLGDGRFGSISFAPSLLPAVSAGHNRKEAVVQCFPPTVFRDVLRSVGCVESVAYTAYGAGLMPIAMRAETPADRRISLTATVDGGGVWFNQRIPTPQGARFNFVARGSLGAAMRLKRRTWLSVGYSHMHLSNGGRGEVNPGIDAELLTLGASWR